MRDAALGNSEALLAGLVLWAFERHLDGRRDQALYLAFAGALLRPEVWPFLGLYGFWLWFAEPWLRTRLVVLGALVPALWFLPEWWGSGDPFRAGARANNPNPGSAAFAEHPALELVSRFRKVVIAPVKVGIIIGTLYAFVMWIRHRGREAQTVAVALGGAAWFVLVAAMTEAGFAGNQRYLIVTTAAVCVLGGLGAARVLQGVGWLGARAFGSAQAGAITAAVAFFVSLAVFSPFIVEKADNTGRVSGGLAPRGTALARPEGHDRRGRRARAHHRLRKRLQRALPDSDGRLRAAPPRDRRGLGHHAGARRRLPHPHGARRPARDEADGRPLPARRPRRGKWRLLTAPTQGAIGSCPRADPDAPTAPPLPPS